MNKASKIGAILSVAIVFGITLWTGLTNDRPPLPAVYYNLDKTRSWNEAARGLGPMTSDTEYDVMRNQYFHEQLAPKIKPGESFSATYDEFMKLTDRPWQWKRRITPNGPPRLAIVSNFVFGGYLLLFGVVWSWMHIVRPTAKKVGEEGLAGLYRMIQFGRRGHREN